MNRLLNSPSRKKKSNATKVTKNWIFLLLSQLFIGTSSKISTSQDKCSCDDESLCQPVTGPPVNPAGELYGFYGSSRPVSGQGMNWTHVTTVAWATSDEIMCLAHQHGARAIISAPKPMNLTELIEPKARRLWIENALELVRSTYRDGLVFDYEQPQKVGSVEGETYSTLVAETRDYFHSVNPSYQIATCVAWSPDNIDGRGYPYDKLAAASDLLYVMDYDVQSQIWNEQCIAGPNAPFPGMVRGIQRFFDLGIIPEKLILGVPWYGYGYECLSGTTADAIYCPIEKVPFRGVNCSDAAGVELNYSNILTILHSSAPELRRDDFTGEPFFNTIEPSRKDNSTAVVVQYWFDDPISLRQKYSWARNQGLAGIGPYAFPFVDPVEAPKESSEMWTAFDSFFDADVSTTALKK